MQLEANPVCDQSINFLETVYADTINKIEIAQNIFVEPIYSSNSLAIKIIFFFKLYVSDMAFCHYHLIASSL